MQQKGKILVVDDDESARRTLSLISAKSGYETETAQTGLEAIQKVQQRPCDVALVDIRLPDMAGTELLAPLRKVNPDIEVIMVTAYASAESAVRALNEGAFAYIFKPVNMDEVLATVREAFEKQRLIKEKRQAEEALRASDQQWSDTFDAIDDAICIMDTERKVVRCNKAMAQMLNMPADEVIGRTCCELVHEDSHTIEGCPTDRAHKTRNRETTSFGRDGRWLAASTHPIFDENGAILGDVHIMEDVTQQRELEEQLRQAAKMQAVGLLAGGVAHDFNNMLTGIKGYTQFVLEQVEDGSLAHHDLIQIRDLAERAVNVTRQLMTFSRQQPLKPVALSIDGLVRSTLDMLRPLIGEHIAVRFIPTSDGTCVMADPGQIEQILINVATNARDAMPNGGELTVETAVVTLDEDYAASHADAESGPHVVLTITDTGCGMDKETRGHIFEPFFTTKGVDDGTGLGLAMAYGIIKQHRGHICVHSEPCKGTKLSIYLPRLDCQTHEPHVQNREQPAPKGTETVLIVDDEQALLDIAHRALESHGYKALSTG